MAGVVVADGDFEVGAGFGIDGGGGRLGDQNRYWAPKCICDGVDEADGGGAEELEAGAAQGHAVGFEGEVGIIAVERVGGDADLVLDLVGRLDGGGGGEAFGQAQARALGDVRRRSRWWRPTFFRPMIRRWASLKKAEVSGSSMAMPMRTRLPGAVAAGILQARAEGLVVPIELGGLARGEVGADGLAGELQDDFARLGRGELHGQDAVLELDREQLGGGIDDVLGAGEVGALAAQAVGAEGDVNRQPEGIAGAHGDAGDDEDAAG